MSEPRPKQPEYKPLTKQQKINFIAVVITFFLLTGLAHLVKNELDRINNNSFVQGAEEIHRITKESEPNQPNH